MARKSAALVTWPERMYLTDQIRLSAIFPARTDYGRQVPKMLHSLPYPRTLHSSILHSPIEKLRCLEWPKPFDDVLFLSLLALVPYAIQS